MNNLAGLGFNGFDENGKAKWDRITNINILKFEVGLRLSQFCFLRFLGWLLLVFV